MALWAGKALLALWAGGAIGFGSVKAEPATVPLAAQLKVSESAADGGTITIAGRVSWQLPAGEHCFYLPWNDPSAPIDPLVRRTLAGSQADPFSLRRDKRHTRIVNRPGLTMLAPFLAKVTDAGTVSLDIVSRQTLPGTGEIIVDSPLPKLLTSCTGYDASRPSYELNYRTVTALAQQIAITNSTGYKIYSQNRAATGPFSFVGNRLSLVLAKGLKVKTFVLGSTLVRFLYRSKEFLKLEETLREAFLSQNRLFGGYAYPVLNVVESSRLESSQTLGIVTLNRPNQDLFRMVQMDVLNWYHWVLVKRLAFQWFGSLVEAASHHDYWLLQGLAELGALESLRANSAHFNLFNFRHKGYSLLSFDYVTVQDLKAAVLSKNSPNTTITNRHYVSYGPKDRQFPFLYVKNATLLRYLPYVAGYTKFERFIRQLVADYKNRRLSPRGFVRQFDRLPSPFSAGMRKQLKAIVTTWWRHPDWPDYRLGKVNKKQLASGKWRTEVTATSKGYGFPIEVRVDDKAGFSHYGRAKVIATATTTAKPSAMAYDPEKTYELKVVVDSPYEPVDVVIDPQHHIYDRDRYNNNSDWLADVRFFPGNARTLSDDGYTVFWFPFISRRSGQNTSLALHSVIMRYLHGYIYAMVEKDLTGDRYAYKLLYSALLAEAGLSAEISLEKDQFDAATRSFKLTRPNVINFNLVKANISAILRHRGNDANVVTNHGTVAAQTRFWLYFDTKCKNVYTAEYEQTLNQFSREIDYHKTLLSASLHCSFGRYAAGLSLFGGKIVSPNLSAIPDLVRFRPQDGDGANIRLDATGVSALPSIGAVGLKLSMPMIFDLPHWFFVLKNSVRIHQFTDYGYSPETDTRFLAAGLGLNLPLGGDFVGAGPIALSVIDINLVLYTKVNDKVGRKPKLLIGLNRSL